MLKGLEWQPKSLFQLMIILVDYKITDFSVGNKTLKMHNVLMHM